MDYADLKKNIENSRFAPVYFFYGEEPFFIDDLVRSIMEKAVDPATRDFNCHTLDAEDAPAETIVAWASSFPMMADRRVVVFRSVQKLSPADRERLLRYVKSPLDSTTLVLTSTKADRREKFYDGLVRNSEWMESKPLYENQAMAWVERFFQARRISISPEAALVLVQQVGNSVWALFHESEKILTFAWGKTRIGFEDVAGVAGASRRNYIWELTDAVLDRKAVRAFNVVNRLLEEGLSPGTVVIDLFRRVRTLLLLRVLLDRGMSGDDAFRTLGLRPFFGRRFLEQVRTLSTNALNEAVHLLCETDRAVKTGAEPPSTAMVLAVHRLIRLFSGNRQIERELFEVGRG